MTLAFDFTGQNVKNVYLKNERVDKHGTKGMWIDRIWTHVTLSYGLDLGYSSWNFEGAVPLPGVEWLINMGERVVS